MVADVCSETGAETLQGATFCETGMNHVVFFLLTRISQWHLLPCRPLSCMDEGVFACGADANLCSCMAGKEGALQCNFERMPLQVQLKAQYATFSR